MEQAHLLIQGIKHIPSGENLDLAFMLELTLVETIDLSGPRLMAEFDDPNSWLKDVVGLKEKDELEVTISDLYVRDGIDEIIKFTVLTRPVSGNSVKINAIASAVFALKTRASKAMVFTRKSPGVILDRLFPGMKKNVGRFPVVEDYHLLSGEYPSYLLRQMAREKGAHVFLRRGTVCLCRLSDIMEQAEPDFTYHYDNATEQNQIVQHTVPSSQHILEDKIIRRYSGWNMTKGWISVGDKSLPPEKSSSQSLLTMKNIGKSPRPALDFTCTGNGFLKPGACIDLVWNTLRINAPLDESLPGRVVASTIAHHYRANNYSCRVKCVVPLERSV